MGQQTQQQWVQQQWVQQQQALQQRHNPAAGHTAGQRSRPLSWIVVAFLITSFALGGAAIIAAMPWLAWVAVGLIAFGGVVGWVTHVMADQGGDLPTDPTSKERGRGDEA